MSFQGVVILGLVILVLGTYANLQAAENQIDKYDEKLTQERIDKIVEDFFDKWDKSDGKLYGFSIFIARKKKI